MTSGGIKVNLVGLDRSYGEIVVTPDTTVTQLYQHVVSAIGVSYVKLTVGGKILADPAENFAHACLAPGSHAVELTVVKLSGPDKLDDPDLKKFKACINTAVERTGKMSWPFGFERLQVLNLQGSPGWTMHLLESVPQFTTFVAALQDMKSLTVLDLTGNNLELEGRELKEMWSAANINPIEAFAFALPPSLEVLKLSHSEDWAFTPFLEALGVGFNTEHAMSNLHELYFTTLDGKPVYPDGRHIAEPLGKCLRCLPSLGLLSLKDCRLWAENLPQIAGVLPATIKVFEFCFDSGEPGEEDHETVDEPSNVMKFLEKTPGLKQLVLYAPHDAGRSWSRHVAETVAAHLPDGLALACRGPDALQYTCGKHDVQGLKRSADDLL